MLFIKKLRTQKFVRPGLSQKDWKFDMGNYFQWIPNKKGKGHQHKAVGASPYSHRLNSERKHLLKQAIYLNWSDRYE